MRARLSGPTLGILLAIGFSAPAAAENARQQQERRDAIGELDTMESVTVVEMRQVCARGRAGDVRAKQLAAGRGFPDVHEICRAAIDAQGKQKLSSFLYLNMALQDMGKALAVDSAQEAAMVENGEGGQLAQDIIDAASKGQTTFKSSLSGKAYELRPELAFDAGHWLGQHKPDLVPDLNTAELEAGARHCFDETPTNTIVLMGKSFPATRACLVIGGHFGKQIRARRPS